MFSFIKSRMLGKKEPEVPLGMMQIRFTTPTDGVPKSNGPSEVDKFNAKYDVFTRKEHVQLQEPKHKPHELNRSKKKITLNSFDQLDSELFAQTGN